MRVHNGLVYLWSHLDELVPLEGCLFVTITLRLLDTARKVLRICGVDNLKSTSD